MGSTTLPSNAMDYEVNLTRVSFPSSTRSIMEFFTTTLHGIAKLTHVRFILSSNTREFLTTTWHVNES